MFLSSGSAVRGGERLLRTFHLKSPDRRNWNCSWNGFLLRLLPLIFWEREPVPEREQFQFPFYE